LDLVLRIFIFNEFVSISDCKLMNRIYKNDLIDTARIAQLAHYDVLIHPSYAPIFASGCFPLIFRDYCRQRGKAERTATHFKDHIKNVLGMKGNHLKRNFQLS
jgi:hypothetical protein